MLGEGPTYAITGSFVSPLKKFSINFSKSDINFCLRSHYHDDNSYLFANQKEIFKLKANNKNVNFLTEFCLGCLMDLMILILEKYL